MVALSLRATARQVIRGVALVGAANVQAHKLMSYECVIFKMT